MNNLVLDRMKRRQRDRRLDTMQRYGMSTFIACVAVWAVSDIFIKLVG